MPATLQPQCRSATAQASWLPPLGRSAGRDLLLLVALWFALAVPVVCHHGPAALLFTSESASAAQGSARHSHTSASAPATSGPFLSTAWAQLCSGAHSVPALLEALTTVLVLPIATLLLVLARLAPPPASRARPAGLAHAPPRLPPRPRLSSACS